ncbi:DoxX-like family protein [Flocculibacter collagenilyticus]|uniref:DoxX-like family protein n=1 Tax=Flocculibacter collagenilyticus TaxID=2744479 RepID=UPI0018F6176D|nr:DoxX-like family protein [Flocculibacter collagenilyticus]
MKTINIARFAVGLSWIYHGLFPKLMHVAPLEKLITSTMGFSEYFSYWITKVAGIGEVIFGVLLIILFKSKSLIWLNIFGLVMLLLYVAIQVPYVLVEAFNPVTTNLLMIAMSVIWLKELQHRQYQPSEK